MALHDLGGHIKIGQHSSQSARALLDIGLSVRIIPSSREAGSDDAQDQGDAFQGDPSNCIAPHPAGAHDKGAAFLEGQESYNQASPHCCEPYCSYVSP